MVRDFHSLTSWRKFNACPSIGFKVILIAARTVISASRIDAVLAAAAVVGTTFVHIDTIALIPGISQIGFPPNVGIVVEPYTQYIVVCGIIIYLWLTSKPGLHVQRKDPTVLTQM